MRHIISILIENEPGALSRVVGLFSARGYNIENLNVAPTEDDSLSRITIVTRGSDDIIEQITKLLNRLIEVVKVVVASAAGCCCAACRNSMFRWKTWITVCASCCCRNCSRLFA